MQNKVNKPEEDFKMIGDWKGQSQILKEKFPQLTKADLIYEKKSRSRFAGKDTKKIK